METVKPWVKAFRRAIKVSVGTGWTVQPDRGYIRVLYGTKKTGFQSINLHQSLLDLQYILFMEVMNAI